MSFEGSANLECPKFCLPKFGINGHNCDVEESAKDIVLASGVVAGELLWPDLC